MLPPTIPGDTPEFPNDKLAEVILQTQDETLLPPEAGESTAPREEWTGDGVNDGNCWFPIHFSYAGEDYTADVQTRQPGVKEYHVTAVTPSIPHLPEPYIVTEHISGEKYEFPVNDGYYPEALGHILVSAIEEGSGQSR